MCYIIVCPCTYCQTYMYKTRSPYNTFPTNAYVYCRRWHSLFLAGIVDGLVDCNGESWEALHNLLEASRLLCDYRTLNCPEFGCKRERDEEGEIVRGGVGVREGIEKEMGEVDRLVEWEMEKREALERLTAVMERMGMGEEGGKGGGQEGEKGEEKDMQMVLHKAVKVNSEVSAALEEAIAQMDGMQLGEIKAMGEDELAGLVSQLKINTERGAEFD